MTIRFDADKDKLVHRAHPYDKAERDGWAGDDETLWYLTDGNGNGRWLYVDRPDSSGWTEVGIARVYRKHLSPAAMRSLAAVLLEAADEAEAIKAAAKAERDAQTEREHVCAQDGGHRWGPPPMSVSHATGVVHSDGTSASFMVCERCGHGAWIKDEAPYSGSGSVASA